MQDLAYRMALKVHFVIFAPNVKTSPLENVMLLWMSMDNITKCIQLRPKKNICVIQVSRLYLGFWHDPKHFIVLKKNIIYI